MDHNATTPLDPQVLEAMLPYFTEYYGNAASIDHLYGAEAQQAVEVAREKIAKLINAQSDEIIFTSGATEANNLAILGLAEYYIGKGKNHIITCVTEHHAVLDPCKYLQSKGWNVTFLPVDHYGIVDLDQLIQAITPQTFLISVMTANNEIGTIAPIAAIGKIAREREIFFHTDATQAAGYISLDVDEMNIDLLSMSAHKMYGPKGIGALFVRKRKPRVRLVEQIHGGGHERGIRSGTLNVPSIVGFGKASELAKSNMTSESKRLQLLRDELWEQIQNRIEDVQLNGHPIQRLPHNLSVSFVGIESRSLLVQLKGYVALSVGSACTTAKVEPSHVILALGYGEDRAYNSVRFGLGRLNNVDHIKFVVNILAMTSKTLKNISML